jgi:hypothetical protein
VRAPAFLIVDSSQAAEVFGDLSSSQATPATKSLNCLLNFW